MESLPSAGILLISIYQYDYLSKVFTATLKQAIIYASTYINHCHICFSVVNIRVRFPAFERYIFRVQLHYGPFPSTVDLMFVQCARLFHRKLETTLLIENFPLTTIIGCNTMHLCAQL